MIGNIYQAPTSVVESGWFIVVGRDSEPIYNATRKPWFLQVMAIKDGRPHGSWIPVTLAEFKEWNPDASVTSKQWLARGNSGGVTELC